LTVKEADVAPNRPSAFITLGQQNPVITGNIPNTHQDDIHRLS